MAAPTPDAALATMVAERPCATRRWLGNNGDAAIFTNYNFFPWDGQPIDSPASAAWTSDDKVHAI